MTPDIAKMTDDEFGDLLSFLHTCVSPLVDDVLATPAAAAAAPPEAPRVVLKADCGPDQAWRPVLTLPGVEYCCLPGRESLIVSFTTADPALEGALLRFTTSGAGGRRVRGFVVLTHNGGRYYAGAADIPTSELGDGVVGPVVAGRIERADLRPADAAVLRNALRYVTGRADQTAALTELADRLAGSGPAVG
ncbi:MAG TPA: hypothetical protein VD866_25435 [Urbifossiella sp.]|nr:hypothetical protein [Urbifossiella sp.]